MKKLLLFIFLSAACIITMAVAPKHLDILFRHADGISFKVRSLPLDSVASASHTAGKQSLYDSLTVITHSGRRFSYPLDTMARVELRPHIPVIYINTDSAVYDVADKVNYLSARFSMSAGSGVDNYFDSIAPVKVNVRGRGNSTMTMPKKPYRLKFDKKISLCGLAKAKNYALIANYIDPTLMHNTCAFEIARRMGLEYTNHSVAVDVVFNGRYCGSYMLTEKVGINAGSVDIDETKGLLLEMDVAMDEDFCYYSKHFRLPVMVKDPDLKEIAEADTSVTAQQLFDSIQADFTAAELALLSQDTEKWRQYFDLESTVRYLLVQNISGNWEFAHPKSLYLYRKNRGEKFYFGPVWDFDWTAEYFTHYDQEIDYGYPLLLGTPASEMYEQISRSEAFWDCYRSEWHRFKNEIWPETKAYLERYAELLESSALRNGELWHPGREDHDSRYWESTSAFRSNLQRYINWIDRRMEYIDQSAAMGLYW